MNASGVAVVAVPRQNSSSVSIEAGSQTKGIAALGFGLDLHPVRDAAVDTETAPLLVIPPKREHLAGPQPEHQEHADDASITVAQVE